MNVAPTSKAKSSGFRSGDRRQALKTAKINPKKLYLRAIRDAFVKLDPRSAIKNPVMFLVWLGTLVTLVFTIAPNLFEPAPENNPQLFHGLLTGILFLTVWLANFAEALAEGRGKAQAEALRAKKTETIAKKLAPDGTISEVPSPSLRQNDTVYLVAGDIIPADGQVIMGVASVDESAITGETVPILKESGSDVAGSVIGSTRIISDELIVRITSDPDKGFIDQMIALLAGKERRQTPNEITLTILLAVLSLVCLLVVATLPALAYYVESPVSVTILIALLVALIPTTIAGLLSAIGIAGMDRVAQFNIIATSGRAVEACGDVNTLILDKTGTITLGNRLAEELIPVNGHSLEEMAHIALAASVFDDTPEGKSIIRLAQSFGARFDFDPNQAVGVEFSEATRMSGTNLSGGREARKGAVGAISEFIRLRNGQAPPELNAVYKRISQQGGTPLAVCLDAEIYGVIYLKDIIKPGIRERFQQLRQMGISTIMLTGDNQITAAVIAQAAGVNEYIAEATPEEKVSVIHREQAAGKVVAMTGDGTNDAPALAKANVGVVMNTGTQAAKEAANIIDLDSDPTKLIDIVSIGKQLQITRGVLTIFSLANDIGKYFALIPFIFTAANLQSLNIMNLSSANSAVLSTLIYNALIIPALIPLALRGVQLKYLTANQLLQRHLLIYGLGGVIAPFIAIKLIDMLIATTGWI
ncbi:MULTISPECIES: potassium-transporting ATPase subunit KdpB [unclassified Nodularia (in: cyanobacteria)]|uniref:potassium-transporting ATPase subunit KdpB n=1 Tax=unclassified Nodularia (in: cyanobacteria) TaxID=2656917 RepID=UPI00187E3EB2|nr:MULTISPECIES: potassium-transporting ATPase subunit KdpB [unclassified Nodularia (in: cyanobacteria)]MBE9198954.1 potassium-transporting ATPase subunit KdpB [Nodularia sp. LEGE 06071]MCC2692734.1 potassium-transporting ATPase subunit KdpB [Nodularia sp. LEGE 04288]